MIVNRIFLSWRRGEGSPRFLVGEIVRQNDNKFTFKYNTEEVEKAKGEGFSQYPEFPLLGNEQEYEGDLKSVFSLRLMPEGRADRNNYLSFWEANEPGYDWFDELALTQGKLATDNFEFLGEYNNHQNGFKFVTDIAGLSHSKPDPSLVDQNDRLFFGKEPDNINDRNAVKVMKGNTFIGYIKRGHNLFFTTTDPSQLELIVKAVEGNGKMNKIYVLVVKK